MKTKRRKQNILNVALKVAIVESGKTALAVGFEARIGENRMSALVRNRGRKATDVERAALARVLGKAEADLFPSVSRDAAHV